MGTYSIHAHNEESSKTFHASLPWMQNKVSLSDLMPRPPWSVGEQTIFHEIQSVLRSPCWLYKYDFIRPSIRFISALGRSMQDSIWIGKLDKTELISYSNFPIELSSPVLKSCGQFADHAIKEYSFTPTFKNQCPQLSDRKRFHRTTKFIVQCDAIWVEWHVLTGSINSFENLSVVLKILHTGVEDPSKL